MRKILWCICRLVIKNFYLRNVKIRITGKIPKKSAIIIANHNNPWDPPLITFTTKRIIHFFTAYLLFKNLLRGYFLRIIQQIPVQHGLKELNEKAFSKASYYLKNGELVGIFPYPSDMIRKKKVLYSGVIRLIMENNVPIIPVKVKLHEKRRWKSFFDVNFDEACITIGKPINRFRKKCREGMSKKEYLSLTKELMNYINNLKC